MGHRFNSPKTTVLLAIVGVAIGSSIATAAMAPSFLQASANSPVRASTEAIEAAEHALGVVLGSEKMEMIVALKIGESTSYRSQLPARRGATETTITRADSTGFQLDVVGTDVEKNERYELTRFMRLGPNGMEIALPSELAAGS